MQADFGRVMTNSSLEQEVKCSTGKEHRSGSVIKFSKRKSGLCSALNCNKLRKKKELNEKPRVNIGVIDPLKAAFGGYPR